jgi:hypothetical protein
MRQQSTTEPDGRLREQVTAVELDGRRFDVKVLLPEPPWTSRSPSGGGSAPRSGGRRGRRDAIVSPMQGTVLSVEVTEGCGVAGPGDLRRRGDEDGERGPRAAAGIVSELSVRAGERSARAR